MDHYGYTREGTLQALRIPHVADEIAQTRMVESRDPHVMLLKFVAAEDDKLLWMVVAEHGLHKLLSKRPRATGDKHNLFRPIHPWLLLENECVPPVRRY